MNDHPREVLLRQFDLAWQLTAFHLQGLATEECLWRPATRGLHVRQLADGSWAADWPDRESYDLGPPSIAWLTWHLGFWWSMVLDHSTSEGTLTRDRIPWPGSADLAIRWIEDLERQWRRLVQGLSPEDLRSADRTRWPFQDRPFADVVAWANVELTKNAAEIGYARFLYAVAHSAP